jgi:hypothetical protein
MFVTTILNVVFILRRSLWNNTNIVYAQSRPIVTTSTKQTHENISNKKYDLFEETYRTFLDSFTNNYVRASSKQIESTYCPSVPPDLQGPIIVPELPDNFTLLNQSSYHPRVRLGGRYRPKTCRARHKVAIIVPYRDRYEILKHFLFHTHTLLQRQQLDYRIYVCEQAFDKTFNKGIVMNGCFKEILKLEPDTPCFIMHDVDLLLIDDRNMYTCPTFPRHLSVAIDKFHFYLPYTTLVGGVLGKTFEEFSIRDKSSVFFVVAMRREHYLLVNGYSTNYWGWGGEDDDMYERIVNKHLVLERPPAAIARYKMLKHTHQKLNPARMKVLKTAHIRIDSDGVNNVKYELLNKTLYHLYTHFIIDVGEQKA